MGGEKYWKANPSIVASVRQTVDSSYRRQTIATTEGAFALPFFAFHFWSVRPRIDSLAVGCGLNDIPFQTHLTGKHGKNSRDDSEASGLGNSSRSPKSVCKPGILCRVCSYWFATGSMPDAW